MTSKTSASPIFIFYWLLLISVILVQPALSGRTLDRRLGSSGGGSTIGVDPSFASKATGGSSPTDSASEALGHGTIGYRPLRRRPICNKLRYANCLVPPKTKPKPCNFTERCRRGGIPTPPPK